LENGIRIRKTIFDRLMEDSGNRITWEMLCSSDKPLVPFMGAGISAWCYPTWNELLIGTVKEKLSQPCAEFVEKALGCIDIPDLENKENEKNFHWMEEIAECIFGVSRSAYKKYKKKFKLADNGEQKPDAVESGERQSGVGDNKDSRSANAGVILQQLRDYVGEESKNKKREAVNALYDAFVM